VEIGPEVATVEVDIMMIMVMVVVIWWYVVVVVQKLKFQVAKPGIFM